MKLSVKTVTGQNFHVEVNAEDTILAVKQAIQNTKGHSPEQQKLIYAGKVLKDDQTLASIGVKETEFIVCMVTKAKQPRRPAASAASTPSAPSSTSSTPSAAVPATTQPSAGTVTPAAPSTAGQPPASTSAANSSPATAASVSAGSSTATTPPTSSQSTTPSATTSSSSATEAGSASDLLSGEQLNSTVAQLCEMGFPEDQVRAALRAAFNNADRAVEYLMNGIPENLASTTQSDRDSTSSDAATADSSEGPPSLEQLRQYERFDSLREMVQRNPATLPNVLQQIGRERPELLQVIHQNQEEFVRMLNEPVTSSSTATSSTSSSTTATPSSQAGEDSGSGGDAMEDAGLGRLGMNPAMIAEMIGSLPPEQQSQIASSMGMSAEQLQGVTQMMSNMPPEALAQLMGAMGRGGAPPGVHTIQLTEEDAEAVNRLCEMGFDRSEAAQAYLACDKNEALAANFLIENMSAEMDHDNGDGGDNDDEMYG